MGTSAKAVLFGRITATQVAAALDREGYATTTLDADKDNVRLSVAPPDGTDRRLLWVFGPRVSMVDDADLYSGERTACSLGSQGTGPEIVRILAEEFGGYHTPADDAGRWISVAGRNQVELTPREDLLSAFQRTLPPDLAVGASRALDAEPESLTALREAIDAYLASLEPGPCP